MGCGGCRGGVWRGVETWTGGKVGARVYAEWVSVCILRHPVKIKGRYVVLVANA